MAQDSQQAKYTEQNILNNVYDQTLRTLAVLLRGYNGQDGQTMLPDAMATKITVSGSNTYIGVAAPGTIQSTAKWQCKKIYDDGSGTTTITWADSAQFTQTATDLTSLTYS